MVTVSWSVTLCPDVRGSSMELHGKVVCSGVQPMRESGYLRPLFQLVPPPPGSPLKLVPFLLQVSLASSRCKEPDVNKMGCCKLCAEGESPMGLWEGGKFPSALTGAFPTPSCHTLPGSLVPAVRGPATASLHPTCQDVARPTTPCLGTRG